MEMSYLVRWYSARLCISIGLPLVSRSLYSNFNDLLNIIKFSSNVTSVLSLLILATPFANTLPRKFLLEVGRGANEHPCKMEIAMRKKVIFIRSSFTDDILVYGVSEFSQFRLRSWQSARFIGGGVKNIPAKGKYVSCIISAGEVGYSGGIKMEILL